MIYSGITTSVAGSSYSATIEPAITNLKDGDFLLLTFHEASPKDPAIIINGTGIPIKNRTGKAFFMGDIKKGAVMTLGYNKTANAFFTSETLISGKRLQDIALKKTADPSSIIFGHDTKEFETGDKKKSDFTMKLQELYSDVESSNYFIHNTAGANIVVGNPNITNFELKDGYKIVILFKAVPAANFSIKLHDTPAIPGGNESFQKLITVDSHCCFVYSKASNKWFLMRDSLYMLRTGATPMEGDLDMGTKTIKNGKLDAGVTLPVMGTADDSLVNLKYFKDNAGSGGGSFFYQLYEFKEPGKYEFTLPPEAEECFVTLIGSTGGGNSSNTTGMTEGAYSYLRRKNQNSPDTLYYGRYIAVSGGKAAPTWAESKLALGGMLSCLGGIQHMYENILYASNGSIGGNSNMFNASFPPIQNNIPGVHMGGTTMPGGGGFIKVRYKTLLAHYNTLIFELGAGGNGTPKGMDAQLTVEIYCSKEPSTPTGFKRVEITTGGEGLETPLIQGGLPFEPAYISVPITVDNFSKKNSRDEKWGLLAFNKPGYGESEANIYEAEARRLEALRKK